MPLYKYRILIFIDLIICIVEGGIKSEEVVSEKKEGEVEREPEVPKAEVNATATEGEETASATGVCVTG